MLQSCQASGTPSPLSPHLSLTRTVFQEMYKGRSGPWKGATPNQFVSWFESFGDLLTSIPFFSNGCGYFNQWRWAPNTTWQPASKFVGQSDSQMNDASNYGGIWIYPRSFSTLPTPPGAKDASGKPLPTNVAEGKPGSRVIFWAHGSAYAVLQAKDFFWLHGQMLCEQTGNVVLVAEYGLSSDVVYPQVRPTNDVVYPSLSPHLHPHPLPLTSHPSPSRQPPVRSKSTSGPRTIRSSSRRMALAM